MLHFAAAAAIDVKQRNNDNDNNSSKEILRCWGFMESLQIGYLKENQSAKDQSDLGSFKTKYL
jgi:hypothetical protein